MSAHNPKFNDIDRAAYEMPYLVKNLGDVDCTKPLDKEQRDTIDAIGKHANNSIQAIVGGIASVGHMMSAAARSADGIESHHVGNLADLIKHLAVELEYLHDLESDMCAIPLLCEKTQANARPTSKRREPA